MRPEIDLSLLRDSLIHLQETTYFSGRLHEFAQKLISVVEHVLNDPSRYGPQVVALFAANIRIAQHYLEGSTTKEAPYEMEFCLKAALPKWVKRESLITTALTAEQDFHFLPADPWTSIKNTITDFDAGGYDPLLVFVGVLRLYVHKPLYCIPLYHELGHFVDINLGITQYSLLLNPPTRHPLVERNHRQEHFADLFAACYVGRSSVSALETIAPDALDSNTHPATRSRVDLVEAFLRGETPHLVHLFQNYLTNLSAPSLEIMYNSPDLQASLDDIRPYVIKCERELHGVFESGWKYLVSALDNRSSPWATGMPAASVERIVNDLIEKTIRNRSISERWSGGASL